jgi:AmmeMemoRadiSam system protein B
MYSGPVAGHTFAALRQNAGRFAPPEVVVVLGFHHSASFRGVALMDGDAFATPLGEVALDSGAAACLCKAGTRVRAGYELHGMEHSAENLVPFVQAAVPGVPAVIGLIGDHDSATLDALSSGLHELAAEKRTTVMASTDLLHDPDYERVARTDKQTLACIAALDEKGLLGDWSYGNQLCCGIMPVLTALRFARDQHCTSGTVLYYRNSGDDFPESRGNWVVGYGAVAFAAGDAPASARQGAA